jgi:aminopeptidase YwaD
MKKPFSHPPLALFLIVAAAQPAVRAGDSKAGDYVPTFTADQFIAHVQFLAHDDRGGRFPGTTGIAQAAEYLAGQFAEIGLEPGGVDGTYFQPFTVRAAKQFDPQVASLRIEGFEKAWEAPEDFTAFPFSRPGKIEAPLAFAGYGIHAPDFHYDDYAGFDASGKVLLILRSEPKADDPEAAFGGQSPSSHALFSRKARLAKEQGALALLIVDSPTREPEGGLYRWSNRSTRMTYDLPMMHITSDVANAILDHANMPPLETLARELDEGRESLSTDLLGVSVSLNTGVRYVEARNVIGILKGAEAGDEYVVVGAHYDHLGRTPSRRSGGGNKPQIHNGADDNASGTTAVLELARALAAGPRPRRSVVFITFSAEELGLVGSRHFVEEPTIPLEQVRAMMNFDMIGRLGQHEFAVWGVSTAAEFAEIVRRAAEPLGLEYTTPPASGPIFRRSDHWPFYQHEIPVLFPFTGLHSEYHMPQDDWELIDAKGAAKVVRFSYAVVDELANMKAGREDATEQETRQHARQMPRVRLGIMPALDDDGEGLGVDAVVPGGAAADADMHEGDRIIRVGAHDVHDIMDYMSAAREFAPGDETDVVVLRDGEEVTLHVTFRGSGPTTRPAAPGHD